MRAPSLIIGVLIAAVLAIPFIASASDPPPAAAVQLDAGVQPPQTGIGTSPVDEPAPSELARDLYDALRSSRWLPAFGLLLVGVVMVARRYGSRAVPWLASKPGAFVLAFLSALVLIVGLAVGAGRSLDPTLLTQALATAWVAAGGWGHVKDIWPALGDWASPPSSGGGA